MARSLSALESKLILHLEWNKQSSITIRQAVPILGVSYNHARLVLHRLARDHWLAPIVRGTYELIPAERGEYAFVDTNPYFVGSLLVKPYYFTYSTAAYFHGLSTQSPVIVYIATPTGKTQLRRVRDKDYRVVKFTKQKFFGYTEVDALGLRVWMSDVEKTIVDCLHKPEYAGGIPEIAGMLGRRQTSVQWDRLVDYAARFHSSPLIQRLGYLCDVAQIPLANVLREKLLSHVGQGNAYLGSLRHWGKGGDYNAAWRIVDNIPRRELLAEVEAH